MKQLFRWPLLLFLRYKARRALRQHRPLIVGVAGAVGKSSTVQAIYAALSGTRRVRYTPGNSETGVPLGILNIKQTGYGFWDWVVVVMKALVARPRLEDIEILVVEMGTDELTAPKNMEYLLSIVQPDIAVWLNVYAAHLSQFELGLSRAERQLPEQEKAHLLIKKIAAEDGKIITASECHTALYCADNAPVVDELRQHEQLLSTKRVFTFGSHASNSLTYVGEKISLAGTTFAFRSGEEEYTVSLPGYVLPTEYREVIAAALLTARACGVAYSVATKNIMNNLMLPPSRSSVLPGLNGSTIIDSTYNASPEAVKTFVQLTKKIARESGQPTVFLCGDMRELGVHAPREHQAIADLLPGTIDCVYCVGELTKQYVVGYLDTTGRTTAFKELRWFATARELGAYLKEHLPNQSLVLAKGSQNTIFLEEAVAEILRNTSDRAKLCRQENYWQKMKEKFFLNKNLLG
jgi:UDP-N-acetylmuramoyl-tripeptide--D-alanyl-D-alanine ligase